MRAVLRRLSLMRREAAGWMGPAEFVMQGRADAGIARTGPDMADAEVVS